MIKNVSLPIKTLLDSLPTNSFRFKGDETRVIRSVTWDYQKVGVDCMYFCVEDEEFQEKHIDTNSCDYWKEAVDIGAVCLVTGMNRLSKIPPGIDVLEVENVNQSMALIIRAFYNDPMADMKVIGITGTNGKTTTSQLIDSILLQADHRTGVVGTIGVFHPSGKQEAGHLSNPMAAELFAIVNQMKEEKVNCLTMEVTSQAMTFDRNHAVDFDVAVFTNLTQDYLDYHKTFESYKKCKLKHFQRLGSMEKKAYGIVNVDDIVGKEFVEAVDEQVRRIGKVEVLTYGIRNKDADLVAYPRQMTGGYSEFDVFLRGNHLCRIFLPMAGLFNIYNGLAAFGATFALGISIGQIVEGLKNARRVDGRFERVDCNSDFDVYVDYAHTPDSLEKILQEIRDITRKRVITVFGCGGDRDRTKRAIMGGIGARLSDVCVVTSDNPRSEDPQAIINDIKAGIVSNSDAQLIIEQDRRQAIYLALEMASAEDSVLIAGKGHENYQIIGKTRHQFSDRMVVLDYFRSSKADYSRAIIEINTGIMRENYRLIFKDKPKQLKVMSVVKDDALGHGIIESSKEAIAVGCEYLGVACLSEALEIRKVFEDVPILVFGERPDNEIPGCVRQNLSIQIQSVTKARLIGEISVDQEKETRVHLKVDTGMGRYGVRWDSAIEAFKAIQGIKGIKLEGIMTHFARSDEADKEYANKQWQRFYGILERLDNKGILPPLIHACNTGGYLDLPQAHGNMVRLGILPTGVYPSKVCRRINMDEQVLKPVMTVKTRIAFLKVLQPGDCTGYGMHFMAEHETKVAVLPMGYGDGYPRLRNKGYVLIKGQKANIIGGNGMDAIMVNVSKIPDVKVGDEVILLGKQEDEEITAVMLSDWAGTVTYDILAGWSKRMDRVFVSD